MNGIDGTGIILWIFMCPEGDFRGDEERGYPEPVARVVKPVETSGSLGFINNVNPATFLDVGFIIST